MGRDADTRGGHRMTTARARLMLLVLAGTTLGHIIAYVLAMPNGGQRAALLSSTGHGYLPAVSAVALIGALWVAASWTLRHVRAGMERRDQPLGATGLLSRLALYQIVLFFGVEALERFVSGTSVASLTDHRLALLGVLSQLAAAIAIAVLLWLCGFLGRSVGRALVRPKRIVPRAQTTFAVARSSVRFTLIGGALGSRAPPSLLI